MHSFMLVRHGHVIAEAWWKPEAPDKPHVLWSLSKSFNATAVGLAIEEGKLYLQKGMWNGKQLLPPKWAEEATSKQVPNDGESHSKMGGDWRQGYGFQFWRCTHNAYRCDGANGQFCVVIPDKDAVIAITAQTGDMQDELNVVWEKLYPAFGDQALPDDAAGQEKLKQIVANLKAHPVNRGR